MIFTPASELSWSRKQLITSVFTLIQPMKVEQNIKSKTFTSRASYKSIRLFFLVDLEKNGRLILPNRMTSMRLSGTYLLGKPL